MESKDGVEFGPCPEVDLPSWVRRATWTYHHPIGTCAMGGDPSAGAVVDRTCRVHGVSGLWVVDASVMPDMPSANTHVPTVMVAERQLLLWHDDRANPRIEADRHRLPEWVGRSGASGRL
jgi:choline dehydrogenase-like flavoprotein